MRRGRGLSRQRLGPIGVGRLDARERTERALHAEQRVERVVRRHGPSARGRDEGFDGDRGAPRMEDRSRQERDDRSSVALLGTDDPRVEELPRRGVELRARRVVERVDHHLRSAPEIHENLTLRGPGPLGPLERSTEEAPVRALERPEPGSVLARELGLHRPPEASPGDRVAPERSAALLEPWIFGREGARARLELRSNLGRTVPVLGSAELDDASRRFKHSHPERAGVLWDDPARMENRIFFPQAALDQWLSDGTVDLQGTELTILALGRRYRITEAVRVLRDVTDSGDAQQLVGRVKAKIDLETLGAELVESSMLIGDAAYDVELGWAGVPSDSFAAYMASKAQKRAKQAGSKGGPEPKTEEELLATFVSGRA